MVVMCRKIHRVMSFVFRTKRPDLAPDDGRINEIVVALKMKTDCRGHRSVIPERPFGPVRYMPGRTGGFRGKVRSLMTESDAGNFPRPAGPGGDGFEIADDQIVFFQGKHGHVLAELTKIHCGPGFPVVHASVFTENEAEAMQFPS